MLGPSFSTKHLVQDREKMKLLKGNYNPFLEKGREIGEGSSKKCKHSNTEQGSSYVGQKRSAYSMGY